MGDIMLLGVLRMPFDDNGDLHLMQLKERCLEAANRIEADEAKLSALRSANADLAARVEESLKILCFARDSLYNGFEPDNQSRSWHKVNAAILSLQTLGAADRIRQGKEITHVMLTKEQTESIEAIIAELCEEKARAINILFGHINELSAERDALQAELDKWPQRYDDAVQPLQNRCSEYLSRAEKAEAECLRIWQRCAEIVEEEYAKERRGFNIVYSLDALCKARDAILSEMEKWKEERK